jgi:hypothetical protein
MAKKKTESNVSPKGGKRGCLCADGTYSSECCDGTLQAQGIGALESQSTSTITHNNEGQTIVTSRG